MTTDPKFLQIKIDGLLEYRKKLWGKLEPLQKELSTLHGALREAQAAALREALEKVYHDASRGHPLSTSALALIQAALSSDAGRGWISLEERAAKDEPTSAATSKVCDECEDGRYFDPSHGCTRKCLKCDGTGKLAAKEKP